MLILTLELILLNMSWLWELLSFFVVLIILKGLLPRYRLIKARKATKDGKFSEAYQIYNSIIVQYSNKYKLPEIKEIPLSVKDVSDIGKNATKNYIDFWMKKPSSPTCYMAVNEIIEIDNNITIFEVYTTVRSEKYLTLEEYKEAWKDNLYPDQENLPVSINYSLEKMYNSDICLVQLQGESYTYFEGIFFNPDKNICFKVEKKPGSRWSKILSMKTGNWLSIIRINRALCDPVNNDFFNARNIQGRWYSEPFNLKSGYHLFSINLEISGGPNFPLS